MRITVTEQTDTKYFLQSLKMSVFNWIHVLEGHAADLWTACLFLGVSQAGLEGMPQAPVCASCIKVLLMPSSAGTASPCQ